MSEDDPDSSMRPLPLPTPHLHCTSPYSSSALSPQPATDYPRAVGAKLLAHLASQVELTYASGLTHTDLTSNTYDSWIDVSTLIAFTSAQPAALSLSPEGRLTLLDNHHSSIELEANVRCEPYIRATTSQHANLAAAPLDVDFGALSGLQFAHTPGAGFVDVPVHVRPAIGSTLKAFQITLGPLDTSLMN